MELSGSLFSGVSAFIGLDLASGWVDSVDEAVEGTIGYVADEYMRASDAAQARGDWEGARAAHQMAWHYYDLADYLESHDPARDAYWGE